MKCESHKVVYINKSEISEDKTAKIDMYLKINESPHSNNKLEVSKEVKEEVKKATKEYMNTLEKILKEKIDYQK